MITSRDYWRVMNGGYLDNPHFHFRSFPKNVVLVAVDSLHYGVLGEVELKMVRRNDRVSYEGNSIGAAGAQPSLLARPSICMGARIRQAAQR